MSTGSQVDVGLSLRHQEDKIRAYCALHDLELLDVLVDDGESGRTLDRPQMQELLRRLHSGDVDAIVVYRLDRLTRAPRDLFALVEDVLTPAGIDIHSVCEHLDTRTPIGRAIMGMMSVFAQMEVELTRERTRDALLGKKARGERLGTTPFGFRHTGHGQPLAPHPEELATVRRLFDLCEADMPFTHVAERLNAEGHKPKRSAVWHSATVRNLWLRRDVYAPLLAPLGTSSVAPAES